MSMIKIIEPVQANLTEEERLSAWSAIRAGGGNPSGYQFYYGPELRDALHESTPDVLARA